MAELRETKKIIKVRLSYKQRERLDKIMTSWNFETKKFIFGILKSHFDDYYKERKRRFSDRSVSDKSDEFRLLQNPEEFRSWQKRFEETGQANTKKAYEQLLKKELTFADVAYLVYKLRQEMKAAIVPREVVSLMKNLFLAHLKKEIPITKGIPKKPFLLVTGPTGSGKTFTIKAAIDEAILEDEYIILEEYESARERILKKHPLHRYLPFLHWFLPIRELADLDKKEELRRNLAKYKRMLKYRIFRKTAQRKLEELKKKFGEIEIEEEEESFKVDYMTISPHQVQTMWYGETGANFIKAVGSPEGAAIRHILEAHAVLVDPQKMKHGDQEDIQATVLSSTVNKVMDEITAGMRDCILIADTHSPEEIAHDSFRRFDELGYVLDISNCWRDKKNLEDMINLEANQHDIRLESGLSKEITNKVFSIFSDKGLTITPAYVRKLVASIIEQKNDLELEYFQDERLVRVCFENVARNTYGDLYKKVVKKPKAEEGYAWEKYQGKVKEDFFAKVTSTLIYGGPSKGVVLTGPPGSGKTFLALVAAAACPDITYIGIKLDDLSDPMAPIESTIRGLDEIYAIAKLCAPTMIVVNEAEAIAKKRDGSPYDKITNKYLDILDGEESIKGTFTVWTTNLFEGLDPAATREERLEVMLVDGKLTEKEIYKIIEKEMGNVPTDTEEVTNHAIYNVAKNISNIPAGYVSFVKTLKDLRNMEFQIIRHYKTIFEGKSNDNLEDFIKLNAKTIVRALEALLADSKIAVQAKKDMRALIVSKGNIYQLFLGIDKPEDYKLKKSHLINARIELLKNPQKKAAKDLDEFTTDELSQDFQVGKIIGAAYGDNRGWLTPINSYLKQKGAGEGDIIVTGVTKGSVLQQADYTEMAIQSATEALTLNIHYLQNLLSEDPRYKHIDASVIIGTFFKNRTIHHQMESVSYMGGGPSAGFALSINTLSILLNIPVYNDFGITGAPAIRGTSKDKAGSSVIIGGEDKKAERVLMNLRRMYVPKRNYDSIPFDQQESYWDEGKIIIPVGDYREVIPEVLYFDKDQQERLGWLIDARIAYNRKKLIASDVDLEIEEIENKIKILEKELKESTEFLIVRKLMAIYAFCKDSAKDEFLSPESIFEKYDRYDVRKKYEISE